MAFAHLLATLARGEPVSMRTVRGIARDRGVQVWESFNLAKIVALHKAMQELAARRHPPRLACTRSCFGLRCHSEEILRARASFKRPPAGAPAP